MSEDRNGSGPQENALRSEHEQERERYRTLFEAIEALCIVEPIYDENGRGIDYRFIEANSAFEQHTGLTNAIGHTAMELIPNLEPYWPEVYGRIGMSGIAEDFAQTAEAMGRFFEVHAFPIGDRSKRHVGIRFSDVTARKKGEEAIRNSAELNAFRLKLTDSLRNIEDIREARSIAVQLLGEKLERFAVFVVDLGDGVEQAVVRSEFLGPFRESFGGTFDARNFGRRVISKLLSGHPVVVDNVLESPMLDGGESFRRIDEGSFASFDIPLIHEGEVIAVFCVHANCPYLWRNTERTLIEETAGRLQAAVQRIRTSTGLRTAKQTAEAAKREAEEANRAKSAFLANMSHEVRTPLNGLLGMLEHVRSTELTCEQKESIETAFQSGRHLLTLINDILDLSQIESGAMPLRKKAFRPKETAEEVVEIFAVNARAKGLTLTFDANTATDTWYMGDEGRLRQILFNLIGNAIKFTDSGGVEVVLEHRPHEGGRKEELRITVRDTGMGISETELSMVHEPFHRSEEAFARNLEGSGLGLGIVSKLVSLMEGSIEFESAPGEGTTVTIELSLEPAAEGSATEAQKQGNPDPASGVSDNVSTPGVGPGISAGTEVSSGAKPSRPIRILVAEDERINRLVAEHLIRDLGYEAICVANGKECIETLEREPFDIVLMDIQMPKLDGVEATRQIRQLADKAKANIPVIALTAYAMAGDRGRFTDAGMTDYVSKPIRVEELAGIIGKYCARAEENP